MRPRGTVTTSKVGEHSVWEVYDLWRTARLNRCYYGERVSRLKRFNVWCDIALAVIVPGSAASGVAALKDVLGAQVWVAVAAVASVVAIAKPFLKFPERIQKIEACLAGYRTLDFDLGTLASEIARVRRYGPDQQLAFEQARARMRELATDPPGEPDKAKLRRACTARVNLALPSSRFFVPEDDHDAGPKANT